MSEEMEAIIKRWGYEFYLDMESLSSAQGEELAKKFADELLLVQATEIAREIENDCLKCLEDIWCGKDEKNQDCKCICHYYAEIARGKV